MKEHIMEIIVQIIIILIITTMEAIEEIVIQVLDGINNGYLSNSVDKKVWTYN